MATEITSSIVISPSISGVLHSSDLEGSIVITPSIGGVLQSSALTGSIVISLQNTQTAEWPWEEDPSQWSMHIMQYIAQPGLNVTRPMRTFQGTGIVSALGTLNIARPSREAAFVGSDNSLGILNITLPMRAFYGSVITGVTGTLNVVRPSRFFKGPVRQDGTATLNITLPRRSILLTGAVGPVGALNVSIPVRRLSFSGILSTEGVLSITRPVRQVLLWTLPTTYGCMVMNLKNKGLTEYSNYLFNSMCRFNGMHLGATSTGIFNLDSGDTDAGTLIDWNFRTGYLDMVEQGVKKRIKQAWLSYKSNGDIMLTVIQPDGESYEYDLTGYEVYETGLRVKFGKGFRSRYLAFDVSNIDGSSMVLDALKLQFDKVLKER